ncbi:MAG: Gfo/Idh/MocA family oxidoreductase [Verrucomicrobiaceae bacterium]|nr:Gfo/Idh/MocA family oxidoreductase [Verrucomicrobiaceae bacterium]
MNRRHFIRTAVAFPFVTSGMRAASPNGKLRHAAFGASGMSASDYNAMSNHPMWELVAVADVDTRNFAKLKQKFPNVRCYQDWRELLEKEAANIDSVNVSTPDHMHGPIGLKALELGKHVYGQKPLAQNLWECRQLMLKAREKNVMTQMGIQVSSDFSERYAVELVHMGVIGKIKEVHTFSNKKWGDMDPVPTQAEPVPQGFDWDLWLGPAEPRPYFKGYYHPSNWRKRRDFGTGTLGDMGCHMFSGWFHALDIAAPISVKSTGLAPANETNWAINGQVEYTFKGTQYTDGDVKVTWYDGDNKPPQSIVDQLKPLTGNPPKIDQGSIYVGTDGIIHHPHGGTPRIYPAEKFKTVVYPTLEKRNHYFDFIDCCLKGGSTKPTANFDFAGPMTEAVLLGCLASVFPGETLQWDSPALKIPNNEAANALVKRKYRKGWEIG